MKQDAEVVVLPFPTFQNLGVSSRYAPLPAYHPHISLVPIGVPNFNTFYWVAATELKLSYYIGETLITTYMYTHYGNLI